MKTKLAILKRWKSPAIILLFFIILIFLTMNCHIKQELKMSEKFDAALRMKIHEMDQNQFNHSLSCFIKLGEPLNEQQKSQLEKIGLKLLTATGTIITVQAQPDALKKASELKFVESISLSQENQVQSRN